MLIQLRSRQGLPYDGMEREELVAPNNKRIAVQLEEAVFLFLPTGRHKVN